MLKLQIKLSSLLFLITMSILVFSLTQCCSSLNNNKEEKVIINNKDISKRPLTYGSAKVVCTILRKDEKDDKVFCTAKIDTVLGYGPGTKPIGIGSIVELELSEKLVDKTAKSLNDLFKINSRHKLLLAFIPKGFSHNNKDWKIISREN